MSPIISLTGLSLALSVAFFSGACAPSSVRIDASSIEVVVPYGAPAATRFAAVEMTNILFRVFGREAPLRDRPSEGMYPLILGTNAWSRAAGLAPEVLKRDSFCVKIGRDRAFIAGCDDLQFSSFTRRQHQHRQHTAAISL